MDRVRGTLVQVTELYRSPAPTMKLSCYVLQQYIRIPVLFFLFEGVFNNCFSYVSELEKNWGHSETAGDVTLSAKKQEIISKNLRRNQFQTSAVLWRMVLPCLYLSLHFSFSTVFYSLPTISFPSLPQTHIIFKLSYKLQLKSGRKLLCTKR